MMFVARRMGLWAWSAAYRLAEAELGFVTSLPRFLLRLDPHWPLARTTGLDVGASVGAYSLAMHGWCREVVAVEPNAVLARHLRALALPRLRVAEIAAWDEPGQLRLTDRARHGGRRPEAKVQALPDGAAPPAWSQPCEARRLDALLDPGVEALVGKIDVEGAEAKALHGMGNLLDLRHILLVVEIEARHGDHWPELFELLASRGLWPHQLIGRSLVAASPSQVLRTAGRSGGRLARLRGYRNNFIFLRSKGRPEGEVRLKLPE